MLKVASGKSFFLFGPRGTGKTTWARAAFPKALYLDLLEAGLFNDLLANPQRLENLIPAGFNEPIIIDEVQKIPALLDEVHRLIEKRKCIFILTGSSARKLRRQGPNLLAGRALTYSMHPLSATEMEVDFDMGRALRFGMLPAIPSEPDPGKYLESYVRTYLEEEIRQEGLTRNLAAFARFLEAASFSQGSVLSIASVARDCGVDRKVAENYFAILEDLLIGMRLPAFTKRSKRRMVSHPKFYFFDVGVFRTLRPSGPLDTPEEAEGPALETLLLQNLLAVNDSLGFGYKVFYWRTSNQYEVDFVLYGKEGLIAIEVKRGSRVHSDALAGLKSFGADYPMARLILAYGGTRRMQFERIEAWPMEALLKDLPSLLFPAIKARPRA
ncbi:MAG TPA: AAA family ATPase [Fibrobacteria bacterium]|nr:AAA family ATPase [Fibrobacteria bacterium]